MWLNGEVRGREFGKGQSSPWGSLRVLLSTCSAVKFQPQTWLSLAGLCADERTCHAALPTLSSFVLAWNLTASTYQDGKVLKARVRIQS